MILNIETKHKYIVLWICILAVTGAVYIISEEFVKDEEKQRASAIGFFGLASGFIAKLEADKDKKLKAIQDLETEFTSHISKIYDDLKSEISQHESRVSSKDDTYSSRISEIEKNHEVFEERLNTHIDSVGHYDTQQQLSKLSGDYQMLTRMLDIVVESERKLNQLQRDMEDTKNSNKQILDFLRKRTDFNTPAF